MYFSIQSGLQIEIHLVFVTSTVKMHKHVVSLYRFLLPAVVYLEGGQLRDFPSLKLSAFLKASSHRNNTKITLAWHLDTCSTSSVL